MTVSTLLVDFGASRVKSALWSHEAQMITGVRECVAPPANLGARGEVEIDPEAYWRALEKTAGELLCEEEQIEALWLCTEMHGALIGSAKLGAPLSPYISWRDERSRHTPLNGPSTFDRLQACGDTFFEVTGMRLRSGLPFLTLAHLQLAGQLPRELRLFTLADWLLWRGGERDPAIHSSLAAGTGLFDIRTGTWSERLLEWVGLPRHGIRFPRIAPIGSRIGSITLGGRIINVYGGLGDLQAAACGAGFPKLAPLIVNLGTGSQVLASTDPIPAAVERRPGAFSGLFGAITHIPSGRALNVFAGLIDGCAEAGGGRPFFWDRFAALTAAEVLGARADIDLNVFDAAWRYSQGGSIGAIHEGCLTVDSLLATLARSWLQQYVEAIDMLDPLRIESNFLFSGGLSRRGRFIRPVLERLCGRTGIVAASRTGEETLDGLLTLALHQANATSQ
jgi:sugar (pentulose or hexulose) kinase